MLYKQPFHKELKGRTEKKRISKIQSVGELKQILNAPKIQAAAQ